jgi:hypothetical protein
MGISIPKSNSLGHNNAAPHGRTFRLHVYPTTLYLCPTPFISVSLFWCQRSKDPHRKSFFTRVYGEGGIYSQGFDTYNIAMLPLS